MRKMRFGPLTAIVALGIIVGAVVGIGCSSLKGTSDSEVLAQSTPLNTPTLEWFGWSHFRITSAEGKVIHLNPFVTGNPDASITADEITKVDFILAPNGHGDEIGDTVDIAKKTGATVVAGGFELGSWLIEQGVPTDKVVRSNPGNRHTFGNITVRVVNSVHGSGLPKPTSQVPYGGPAAGFVITLEDGYTIYFAGSSAATLDMGMWAAAFKPNLVIVPLNPGRDPLDAAMIVKLSATENSNLKLVIPHHHRVTPSAGTDPVGELEGEMKKLGLDFRVLNPTRNDVVHLTKS